MDSNLIPFGLRNSDNKLVDVSEVSKGISCDCICPSCKVPLVARKGDVNQWHFAHHHKESYKAAIEKCEFSLFVFLRMMAKQIFSEESIKLSLPECFGYFYGHTVNRKFSINDEFKVTKESFLELSDVLIEQKHNDTIVDVIGKIQGKDKEYEFICYLTHPGRDLPETLKSEKSNKCGIISIDLDMFALFYDEKADKNNYKSLLQDYISQPHAINWIHHPRYETELKKLLERKESEYREKVSIISQGYGRLPNKPLLHSSASCNSNFGYGGDQNIMAIFNCKNCGHEWQEVKRETNQCKKCSNHLYSVVVRYLG